MQKIKQLVLTIHGVNPDRKWQERVERVLDAHFDCRHLSYEDYDGMLGSVKAVFLPWLIPFVILSLLFGFFSGGSFVWRIIRFSPFLALFFLGLRLARRKRSDVLDRTMVDFENAVAGHPESPHVIAHSFGTYLMGRALRKFPEAKFSRIVFVGCVLPCTFAWERILMDKKSAFEDVRNEQGLKDWVVLLAGLAGWFTWDIGCAGWRGFKGSKNFIHNGNRPMDPCTKCETLAAAAPVHNIPLKEFLHSDHFLGSRHAQKLWLPFLWGFSPQEYEDYLIPCWDAAYSQQEGLSDDLADREEKLRKRVWTWTSSTGTLEEHIKRHIILELTAMSQPLPPDGKLMDKIDVVVFHLYWLVIDAFQESEKKGHRNLELIAALHPRTAISRAVKEALEL